MLLDRWLEWPLGMLMALKKAMLWGLLSVFPWGAQLAMQ
jgi:hypothetical protein